jgi:hypothetical protein
MKKNLEDHKCTNMEQWRDALKMVWLEKTEQCDFLQKLVTSIPKRMQEVID